MGRGSAKSAGIGLIKWTFKAIFCSTALIGLVTAFSIIGAFLFQAVENTDSIRNSHVSLKSREEYLASLDTLVQDLCQQLRQTILDNTASDLEATYDNPSNITNSTEYDYDTNSTTTDVLTTTELPQVQSIDLPSFCTNSSEILDSELREYEWNLTRHLGWRFDFRDKDRERTRWTLAEALLFSVTITTTIGYGNLVPKTTWGRIATMFYAMVGIPLMLFCLAYIGNIWANVLRHTYTALFRCCQRCRRAAGRKTGKMNVTERQPSKKNDTTNGMAVDPEIVQVEDQQEEELIPVPAWLAFLILVSYIAGGSVLFRHWENWNYLESIYFCFITFSTIGFGDFVPGDSVSESDPERAALCAFYILFGLATMSMVISVIQEDVIRVVYKLGNKIGLTKSKKPSG